MKMELDTITAQETKSLKSLEAKISRGLATFFDVGESLAKIRDERLYRASHKTFESYCHEKWGMGRSYASRLIGAASVVENLLPTGNKPTSEAVVRPMLDLKPTQQVKAWETAIEHAANGTPTASEVLAAVKSLLNGRRTHRVLHKKLSHSTSVTEDTTIRDLIKLAQSRGGIDITFREWRVTVAKVKAAS